MKGGTIRRRIGKPKDEGDPIQAGKPKFEGGIAGDTETEAEDRRREKRKTKQKYEKKKEQ